MSQKPGRNATSRLKAPRIPPNTKRIKILMDKGNKNHCSVYETAKLEINGMYQAISSYNDMIWKNRSAYLTITFGALLFIPKIIPLGGSQNLNEIGTMRLLPPVVIFLYSLIALSLDLNYVYRKRRVINCLDALVTLTSTKEFLLSSDRTDWMKENEEEFSKLLLNAGESDNPTHWPVELGVGDPRIISTIIYIPAILVSVYIFMSYITQI